MSSFSAALSSLMISVFVLTAAGTIGQTAFDQGKTKNEVGSEGEAARQQCEDGFVFSTMNNRCYHASRKATTWLAANLACNEMNSQLVVIPDYKTQQAIDHLLSSQTRSGVYWIGLQKNAGVVEWVDKRPVTYSNFVQASISNEDHCAVMVSGKTATWDYFSCENKYLYICQAATNDADGISSTSRATTTTMRTTQTTPRTTQTTARTTQTTPRTTQTTPRTTAVTTGTNYCPSAGNPNYGPGPGTVSSPNYPGQYFNNANCIYTIVLQNYRATLTINAFETEACCDFLYIYDGPSISSPLIKRLAGTGYAGTTYQATYNTMTLRFTSDASGTASGWSGNYYSS